MLVFPPKPGEFKFDEAKSPRLQIISYSDAVRNITIRGITRTGQIHDAYNSTGDRLIQTRTIALTEIPLSIHVETTTASVQRGRLFVRVVLQMAGVPSLTLAAHYVTTAAALAWPGGTIEDPTSGRGYIHTVETNAPAAGAEVVITVPVGELWHVTGHKFELATDANVGTRQQYILMQNTTPVPIFYNKANATQAQSLTRQYYWYQFTTVPTAFDTNIFGHVPPMDLIATQTIETFTSAIEATDTYGASFSQVESWLNP
jgi:hypothetical protein